MFNFICVDGRYTVFVDGAMYEGVPENSDELLQAIKDENREKVIKYIDPEYYSKIRRDQQLLKLLDIEWILSPSINLGEVIDNPFHKGESDNFIYYYKIPYPMPELLVDKLLSFLNDDDDDFLVGEFSENVAPYLNFWSWAALNPDSSSRHQLFNFLEMSGIQLTLDGMLVCYRNVDVKQQGDLELTQYVSNQYTRIKSMKKAPSNYFVYRDMDRDLQCKTYYPDHVTGIYGNLQGLYENINMFDSVFTDNYSKSFKILINTPVSMDRNLCDSNPNSDCSHGLHVGGPSFITRSYFGNNAIAVLVNPMNVVSVPAYNNWKMRVCEYLPISIVEYDEDNKIRPIGSSIIDFDYSKYSIEELCKETDYPADSVTNHTKIASLITQNTDAYIDMMNALQEKIKDRITYIWENEEEEDQFGQEEWVFDYTFNDEEE